MLRAVTHNPAFGLPTLSQSFIVTIPSTWIVWPHAKLSEEFRLIAKSVNASHGSAVGFGEHH